MSVSLLLHSPRHRGSLSVFKRYPGRLFGPKVGIGRMALCLTYPGAAQESADLGVILVLPCTARKHTRKLMMRTFYYETGQCLNRPQIPMQTIFRKSETVWIEPIRRSPWDRGQCKKEVWGPKISRTLAPSFARTLRWYSNVGQLLRDNLRVEQQSCRARRTT